MSMPLRLAPLPSYQCYDCVGCGNCCRGIFAIRITADDCARLRAQGWEREPEFQGIALYTPTREGTICWRTVRMAHASFWMHADCAASMHSSASRPNRWPAVSIRSN